jgi:hypothetical protein
MTDIFAENFNQGNQGFYPPLNDEELMWRNVAYEKHCVQICQSARLLFI